MALDIDQMTSSELTNYITRDGKVLVDIKRLAEAICKGKIKKIELPDGKEIDIAQIVRCRECIRRGTYDCPIYVGGDADHGSPDDWFCADGERKEKR